MIRKKKEVEEFPFILIKFQPKKVLKINALVTNVTVAL